jgi:hypothetical protein
LLGDFHLDIAATDDMAEIDPVDPSQSSPSKAWGPKPPSKGWTNAS